MSRTRRRSGTASAVLVSVAVLAACAPAPAAIGRAPAAVEVAPYVDVTLDVVPDLAQAVRRGVRTLDLGFVVAVPGTCEPAWGGSVRYDDAAVTRRIGEVRRAGGEVLVAFGGESGTDLAVTCRTPADLARAYARVVDALAVTRIDLDVEGRALQDRGAVHRRNLAVRLLQQADRRDGHAVRVSYTLPVDDEGLPSEARGLLRDASGAGVEVDVVNVMTMDMGTQAPDLASRSASAARDAEAFVRGLWPGRAPGGSAWGMIAITPMIGVNDLPSEVFGLDDAQRLVAFARANGVARLSFWSLDRDRPCPTKAAAGGERASPDCSGVQQRPGDFTAAFAQAAAPG